MDIRCTSVSVKTAIINAIKTDISKTQYQKNSRRILP